MSKPTKPESPATIEAMTPDQQVQQVLALASQASPEAKSQLASMGFVIPDVTSCGQVSLKWGYKCSDCGEVALYFVGEEQPALGKPIHMLAWKQDLPAEKINRAAPRCQSCGREVPLNMGQLYSRRIVAVDQYLASRREAERGAAKMRRERASTTSVTVQTQEGGPPVALATNYGSRARVGDLISPESKDKIRAVEAAGLTGGVQRL